MFGPAVLALLSAATYGAADFYGGLATRRAPALAVALLSQVLGTAGLVAFALWLGGSPTRAELAWGALAGLAGAIGVTLLYAGLAIGPASVVSPITGAIAIAIPVLVAALLGDRIGAMAGAGILLATVAVVLVSHTAPPESAAARPGTRARVVGMAIGSGVAIGLFFVLLSRSSPAAGQWPLVASRAASMSGMFLAALVFRTRLALPRAAWGATAGAGLFDTVANALYVVAVRAGELAPVATLASLYPASTVLLARALLGERIHREQTAGLALAAVAIVLIGMGSGR